MYIDNCLKMIREEQNTPRGWTIRFSDFANTIEGFPISTTIDIDELYHDWYGDCLSSPENNEILYDIMIAHAESGRCYLIEAYNIDFETLMRKIERQFYMQSPQTAAEDKDLTMYERIKSMTKEEMSQFIYWVYMNGNRDGKTGYCDDLSAFFGSRGFLLNLRAYNVMPNNTTDDLWDMFEENCRFCTICADGDQKREEHEQQQDFLF